MEEMWRTNILKRGFTKIKQFSALLEHFFRFLREFSEHKIVR